MRSHSTVLRNVLHFQELRDDITEGVFYYDTKAPWDNVAEKNQRNSVSMKRLHVESRYEKSATRRLA